MRYLYEVEGLGFVGIFLFSDQFETAKCTRLRKDIEPYIIEIKNGQIYDIGLMNKDSFRGEYQDKVTGEHYMTLKVNNEIKRVYFKDFYSFPYEDAVKLLSEGKQISTELLFSTFMGQADKVAAIVPLSVKSFVNVPNMGDFNNVLCVPTESDRYKKKDWYHKMQLSPIDARLNSIYAEEETYTSDILSLINSGTIKLVDKTEYVNKMKEEAGNILKSLSKSVINRLKNKNKVIPVNVYTTEENDEDNIKIIKTLLLKLLEEKIAYLV